MQDTGVTTRTESATIPCVILSGNSSILHKSSICRLLPFEVVKSDSPKLRMTLYILKRKYKLSLIQTDPYWKQNLLFL